MKALFARQGRGLVPADDDATALLRTIGQGECVEVEYRPARNARHSRKLFRLLDLVVENTDRWPNRTALIDALKIAAGYVETTVTLDGQVAFKPRSISFAAMDQAEFDKFYAAVENLILTKILPTVDSDALEREVMQMIAHAPYRQMEAAHG